MNWVAPLAFGWLALVALILLIHVLRPRRQSIVVASLWLWQRTLQLERDDSWLDWLRRHLLLILQILIVAAVALALARPERSGSRTLGPPVAVVVDASLSMQLRDVEPSRLDAAKAQAVAFVRSLPRDARVSVIAAGGDVRPAPIGSTDRFSVEAAIGDIAATSDGGTVGRALDMALSLAPESEGGVVALFSDGAFALPNEPVYDRVRSFNVGGTASNLSVDAFEVRRRPDVPDRVQAFAAIQNYGDQPVSATLAVRAGAAVGRTIGIDLPARDRRTVVIDDLPVAAGYVAQLVADADPLPQDNQRFAELASPAAVRVLVAGDEPEPIVRALQAVPNVQASGVAAAEYARTEPHDVYVFQGWVPEALPAASVVLVRPPPDNPLGLIPGASDDSLPRGRAASVLLRALDTSVLAAPGDLRYAAPAWATVDLGSDAAATLAHGVFDGRRMVLTGLDVAAPTATLAPWYPVLWRNIVAWADPNNPLTVAPPLRPDRPVVLAPHPAATRIEIVAPDGTTSSADPALSIAWTPTSTGTYVIRQFDEDRLIAQRQVAVAPAPGAGSPDAAVTLPGAAVVGRSPRDVPDIAELWPWFVAAALLFLAAEWWWFHRVRGVR